MKNIILLLSLLTSFQLFGRIEIVNIFPTASIDACTGAIQLNLEGTGGPFIVYVRETGQLLKNVEGIIFLERLCVGTYSIHVSIAGFSGCEKVLTAEILVTPALQPDITALIDTEPGSTLFMDEPKAGPKIYADEQFTITPNPSNGEFKISYNQDIPVITNFEIYAGRGQLVHSGQIVATEVNIKLLHLPAGTYFIRFIRDNMVIQSNRIIIF